MRILLLMDSYRQDEAARFLRAVLQRLTPIRGLVLNSIAFEPGPLMDLLGGAGIGVRVLRPEGVRPLLHVRHAGKSLKQRTDRPDAVQVFCRWPSLRWRLLLRGLEDVPAAWYPLEADSSPLRRLLGGSLFRLPRVHWTREHRRLLAPTPEMLGLLRRFGAGEARLLPAGVDGVQIHPLSEATRQRMRLLLNVEEGSPLVAVPLHRELVDQESDWMVRLLSQLHEEEPRAIFVLVGSHAEQEPFCARLDAAGLREATRRIGPLNETLPQVFGAAELVLLPLRGGGFHLHAAEAGAAGTPVLSADAGDARFFVHEGETGLLFPPEDAPSAREAFGTLMEDGDLRWRLGQAARARALDEFEAGLTARGLLETWKELAPRPEVLPEEVLEAPAGQPPSV